MNNFLVSVWICVIMTVIGTEEVPAFMPAVNWLSIKGTQERLSAKQAHIANIITCKEGQVLDAQGKCRPKFGGFLRRKG